MKVPLSPAARIWDNGRSVHPPRSIAVLDDGLDQPGYAERVAALGACACLLKPVDEASLMDAIRRCTGRTGSHCTKVQ